MNVRDRVEQIYLAEREAIYSYLLYMSVPPQRAQELTQDSFIKLFLKMQRGETVDNPKAFLYKVAHNFALRHYVSEPSFDELDPDINLPNAGRSPESTVLRRERQAILARAIRDLSPRQRNCLHLRAEGLRYREIAEVTGISISAVGEFLRRAVVRLKEVVDGN